MGSEVINPDELKLGDRLALERTVMGADRTLLAWVRTSMSFISFGFTIYKILEAVEKSGSVKLVKSQTPRNIGIFLILSGILPLALSMYQYRRTIRHLGGRGSFYLNPNMVSAGAILLLGVALLAVSALNLDVM